jgi:hypothetical protein
MVYFPRQGPNPPQQLPRLMLQMESWMRTDPIPPLPSHPFSLSPSLIRASEASPWRAEAHERRLMFPSMFSFGNHVMGQPDMA